MVLVILGCTGGSSDDVGVTGPSQAIALEGGSTLVFQDNERLSAQRARIEQVVRETLAAVRQLLPLAGVTIRVVEGTSTVIPEIGIGGRADSGTITMTFDRDSSALPRSLNQELFPLLAHEMHHVARFRAIGLNLNLLETMVTEGLADQFSIEIAGIAPPLWSSALTPAELSIWTARARQDWFNPNYDYEAWFFGDGRIPRWTGYTIGFDLTGKFLEANPSRRASELHREPATAFVPP